MTEVCSDGPDGTVQQSSNSKDQFGKQPYMSLEKAYTSSSLRGGYLASHCTPLDRAEGKVQKST